MPESVAVAAGMRRLLASEAASNLGSMLSRLAVPWLAALLLDATPLDMAWLAVADVAAGAVATILVGGLVDRSSRRAVMIGADLARAAAMAVVIVLFVLDALPFWVLVVQAAIQGLAAMAFSVARSAWIADHVADDQLTRRNAQMSAASSASESVAFAGGGWLYQLAGPVVSLVTDAVSYLVSAACIRRLPERATTHPKNLPAPRGTGADARRGFAIVLASPVLRALLVSEVMTALSASITAAAYMIFVTRDLALATGIQGLVFASGALGSLAGAALAAPLVRRLGSGVALPLGLLAAGVGALCIPLAPSAGAAGIALLLLHQVVGDTGTVVAEIQDRTLRQLEAPPDARGRVDAALRSVGQGVTLVGALGGGWFATVTGTRPALWAAAGCLLVAAPLLFALLRRAPARR